MAVICSMISWSITLQASRANLTLGVCVCMCVCVCVCVWVKLSSMDLEKHKVFFLSPTQ